MKNTVNALWRRNMLDANVTQWRTMVEKIKQGFDTAGIYWDVDRGNDLWYYGGNFWWARSDYIKKLVKLKHPTDNNYKPQIWQDTPEPGTNLFSQDKNLHRYDAEVWIGTGNPNYYHMMYPFIDMQKTID